METVLYDIRTGSAVTIPDWPNGVTPHGNLFQWQGRTLATWHHYSLMVGPSRIPAQPAVQPLADRMHDHAGIWEMGQQPVNWIIGGLIPRHGLTLMVGDPKVGKSTLLMSILQSMQEGTPWCGQPVVVQPAWIFTDEGPHTLAEAMLQAAPRLPKILSNSMHKFLLRSDWEGSWPGLCASITNDVVALQEADLPGPTLIVIDVFGSWSDIERINDYAEASAAMRPAKDLRDATGCAVLLIHHGRKERGGSLVNRALGSTALTAQADQILSISKPGGDVPSTARDIEVTGRFRIDGDVTRVELVGGEGYQISEGRDPRNALLSLFANVPGTELSGTEIIKARPQWMGEGRARKIIRELVDTGTLATNGEAKNSSKMRYRVVDQQAADLARQRAEPVSLFVSPDTDHSAGTP